MVNVADEQPHGGVGSHLRHRGRECRGHGRAGEERRIPGVKRKDPLANHDSDRHQPAPRRAHPAGGGGPGRIDDQEHRADRHAEHRRGHRDGKHAGGRIAPRRAPHGDPGGQRRRTPERDQQQRMRCEKQGEGGGRAEEKASHGRRLERPPRRHQQDRHLHQGDVGEQHGGDAVDADEPPATEPVTEQPRSTVGLAPEHRDGQAGQQRHEGHRHRKPAGSATRQAHRRDGGADQGGGHRDRSRDQQATIVGWDHERPPPGPASPPRKTSQRRSRSAADSSSQRTGTMNSRPTTISSKPRSRAMR